LGPGPPGDRRLAAVTWAGTAVVAAVVLTARPSEPLQVAGIVLAGALVIVAAGVALEVRRPPGTVAPPLPVAAGTQA
jgi:hypothetical protein